MLAGTFEIKVALLGNVSAGKTTLLNALFRDKYGEVAMKRTTVGANFFYVHSKEKKARDACSSIDAERSEWLKRADNPRTADSTLHEITEDNRCIRETNFSGVQEKHFDIELDEDIIPMAKNTTLVVVDIPGINEAGTDNKYKEYVTKNWHTFDCVLLVMDGKHDVRTDDQMFLFKFVKENQTKRNIPIIILCNKVDYVSEEQEELVRIARAEVEKFFKVPAGDGALKSMIGKKDKKRTLDQIKAKSPVFIPISAVQAYIYLTASNLEFQKFKSFDRLLIEEFGRELVGRVHWWKLSESEKVKMVYDIVKEPLYCQRGLQECNFSTFLRVLDYVIGGEDLQMRIVQEQVTVALDSLRCVQNQVTAYAKTAYEKIRLLGSKTTLSETNITGAFWSAYKHLEDSIFSQFEISAEKQNVNILAGPMDELILFHGLSTDANWLDGKNKAINAMKGLVRRMIGVVLDLERKDFSKQPRPNPLTLYDWGLIKSSIFLFSYDSFFAEAFGREKIMIETFVPPPPRPLALESLSQCLDCNGSLYSHSSSAVSCNSCRKYYTREIPKNCQSCCSSYHRVFVLHNNKCNNCRYQYVLYNDDGLDITYDFSAKALKPCNAKRYRELVHVEVPESLSDPEHFGHIAWKFCQFMSSLKE